MDRRNAIAKARDDWFETAEGRSAMEKITTGLDERFLRNRLESAFAGGYQAAEKAFVKYSVQKARAEAELFCVKATER